ncbi:CBS domain-containing protein [Alkalithermobacter thermoalcaliphilus JW-YL-7 = DSM 7308]|uniref:CBS domain-containing protein n=1 Tax=Alkalithermobacter thermoalcaliphilus JW-YL-7 = DSM 7308 TaxID=1121328 RepID=A0A150FR52_CLOPD|nr:transcriptional regulator, CBS sensor domains and BirA family winged HTH [[Clostridium] paradoxum JW-YL-7 = DSM 7308]SHK64411.1 CBS domain-containing protein [[Clostridium] paradoxum JW-YL-7 = DSM 7308]
MVFIQLNSRQIKIIDIVKQYQPITSEQIASILGVTRATLRPDLAILTMSGILDARPKVGYFYSGIDENSLVSKKINSKKVEEIMSMPIVVTEDTTVYDTIVTMFLENVGTIFVANKGCLSGVVSRKDLLKTAIGGSDISKIPVGITMTRMPNIVVTYPDDSVVDAARKIIEHEVDSLPVVNLEQKEGKEYYKIVGRISKTNITKLFLEFSGN